MSKSPKNVSPVTVEVEEEKSEMAIQSSAAIATYINALAAVFASRVDMTGDSDPLAKFSKITEIADKLGADIRDIEKSLDVLKQQRKVVNDIKKKIVKALTKIMGTGGFTIVSANAPEPETVNEEKKVVTTAPVSAAAHLASRWGNMPAPITQTPQRQLQPVPQNDPVRPALKTAKYMVPGLSTLDIPAVSDVDGLVVVREWSIRYVRALGVLVLKTGDGCYYALGHCDYDQSHTNVMSTEICCRHHNDPNHAVQCDMYHNPLESGQKTPPMEIGGRHVDHTTDNMFTASERVRVVTSWSTDEKKRMVNSTMAIAGNGLLRAVLLAELIRGNKRLEQPSSSPHLEYTSRAQRRRDNKKNSGNKTRY